MKMGGELGTLVIVYSIVENWGMISAGFEEKNIKYISER